MSPPVALTDPAFADRENEDACRVGDGFAVVVDGAGLPKERRRGCAHTVAWFAGRIADTYAAGLADRALSMADALGAAIAAVRDEHADECDLNAGSPSATVAAWRQRGDDLECLVLCDASVVLLLDDGPAHLTDDRLDEVVVAGARAAVAADRAAGREVGRDEAGARVVAAVEAGRNVPGGFWCVHHDPAAAREARTLTVPLSRVRCVVAASDGATRAFREVHSHTLAGFLDAAARGDLACLRDAVRAAEDRHAAEYAARGGKVHDDLTLVVATHTATHTDTGDVAVAGPPPTAP